MIRTSALALLLVASFSASAEHETGKPDLAKGKQIAETVCVACHGADGNSSSAANPNLAGQVEGYLFKQLSNFQSVNGQPALRQNPVMNGMAAPYSDEDKKSLAAYFASQKLKPSIIKDAGQIALGQKLWRAGDLKKGIPACSGCHGPAGAGLPAKYPRLAGQYADYTAAQLKLFRTSERANDPDATMRTIAAKMSDVEIKAVAEYAAGLR